MQSRPGYLCSLQVQALSIQPWPRCNTEADDALVFHAASRSLIAAVLFQKLGQFRENYRFGDEWIGVYVGVMSRIRR
jgi:hypothetical protein